MRRILLRTAACCIIVASAVGPLTRNQQWNPLQSWWGSSSFAVDDAWRTRLDKSVTEHHEVAEVYTNVTKLESDVDVSSVVLRLKNGVTLSLIESAHILYDDVEAFIEFGFMTDPIRYGGLTHFVEHLLARGGLEHNGLDGFDHWCMQHSRGMGNAVTKADHMHFYCSSPPGSGADVAERLADFLHHPILNEMHFGSEFGAIADELNGRALMYAALLPLYRGLIRSEHYMRTPEIGHATVTEKVLEYGEYRVKALAIAHAARWIYGANTHFVVGGAKLFGNAGKLRRIIESVSRIPKGPPSSAADAWNFAAASGVAKEDFESAWNELNKSYPDFSTALNPFRTHDRGLEMFSELPKIGLYEGGAAHLKLAFPWMMERSMYVHPGRLLRRLLQHDVTFLNAPLIVERGVALSVDVSVLSRQSTSYAGMMIFSVTFSSQRAYDEAEGEVLASVFGFFRTLAALTEGEYRRLCRQYYSPTKHVPPFHVREGVAAAFRTAVPESAVAVHRQNLPPPLAVLRSFILEVLAPRRAVLLRQLPHAKCPELPEDIPAWNVRYTEHPLPEPTVARWTRIAKGEERPKYLMAFHGAEYLISSVKFFLDQSVEPTAPPAAQSTVSQLSHFSDLSQLLEPFMTTETGVFKLTEPLGISSQVEPFRSTKDDFSHNDHVAVTTIPSQVAREAINDNDTFWVEKGWLDGYEEYEALRVYAEGLGAAQVSKNKTVVMHAAHRVYMRQNETAAAPVSIVAITERMPRYGNYKHWSLQFSVASYESAGDTELGLNCLAAAVAHAATSGTSDVKVTSFGYQSAPTTLSVEAAGHGAAPLDGILQYVGLVDLLSKDGIGHDHVDQWLQFVYAQNRCGMAQSLCVVGLHNTREALLSARMRPDALVQVAFGTHNFCFNVESLLTSWRSVWQAGGQLVLLGAGDVTDAEVISAAKHVLRAGALKWQNSLTFAISSRQPLWPVDKIRVHARMDSLFHVQRDNVYGATIVFSLHDDRHDDRSLSNGEKGVSRMERCRTAGAEHLLSHALDLALRNVYRERYGMTYSPPVDVVRLGNGLRAHVHVTSVGFPVSDLKDKFPEFLEQAKAELDFLTPDTAAGMLTWKLWDLVMDYCETADAYYDRIAHIFGKESALDMYSHVACSPDLLRDLDHIAATKELALQLLSSGRMVTMELDKQNQSSDSDKGLSVLEEYFLKNKGYKADTQPALDAASLARSKQAFLHEMAEIECRSSESCRLAQTLLKQGANVRHENSFWYTPSLDGW